MVNYNNLIKINYKIAIVKVNMNQLKKLTKIKKIKAAAMNYKKNHKFFKKINHRIQKLNKI